MASEHRVIVNILDTIIDTNITEYSMLLGEYLADLNVDLTITDEYNWAFRMQRSMKQDADLYIPPNINVTKSVVDTVVSKMNTKKPYPFIRSINGLQDTKQVATDVQKFFNLVYEYQKVPAKFIDAFTDACIFGIGYTYVNPVSFQIETLKPFNVGMLDSEWKCNRPRRMLIKYRGFPVATLQSEYGIKAKGDTSGKVEYFHHYIDANDGVQELFVNGRCVKTLPYKCDVLPIVPVYYDKPVYGLKTSSIVQQLEGIQYDINTIAAKTSACAQAWSGNTTYVMSGSNIQPADIDNHVGKVFLVSEKYSQTGSAPVVNVPSPMYDPQANVNIDYYKKLAFETIGVSEMSAESRVDPNIESGVMYRSVIDNESDRLSRAVQQYINGYSDLANLMIELLPDNEDVLPQTLNTSSIKWKDVKKQKELFKISFAVVEQKSQDVSEQSKYVNSLLNQGLISLDEVGYYLDRPDMEMAINQINGLQAGIMQCITRAIKYGDFDIPDFIDNEDLEKSIAREENILYAQISDDKDKNEIVEESLAKLMTLEEINLRIINDKGLLQSETLMAAQGQEGEGATDEVNNGEAQNLEESNPLIEDESTQESDDLVNPEGI